MTDKLRNLDKKMLSDNWYVLNKYSFDYLADSGEWQTQEREVYDRGNGAADGMMIEEACAGC